MSPTKRSTARASEEASEAGAAGAHDAQAVDGAAHARSTPGRRASSGMHRKGGPATPASEPAEASDAPAGAASRNTAGAPQARASAAAPAPVTRTGSGSTLLALLALLVAILNATVLRPSLPPAPAVVAPAATTTTAAAAAPDASVPSEALVDAVVERLLLKLAAATPSVAPDSTAVGPEVAAAKARGALAASLVSPDTVRALVVPMQDEVTTWVAEAVSAAVKTTTGGWETRLKALESRPIPVGMASSATARRLDDLEDTLAGLVDSVAALAEVDGKAPSAAAAASASARQLRVVLPHNGLTVDVAGELSRLGSALVALEDAHGAIADTAQSVSDRTDLVERLAKTTIARLDKYGAALSSAEASATGKPSSAEIDALSKSFGALQEASLDAADELRDLQKRVAALDRRSKFALDVLTASGLWNLVVRPAGARDAAAANTTVLGEGSVAGEHPSRNGGAAPAADAEAAGYGGEADGGYVVLALDPLDRPAFPSLEALLTLNQTVEVLLKQVDFVLSLSNAPGAGEGGEEGSETAPPAFNPEEGAGPGGNALRRKSGGGGGHAPPPPGSAGAGSHGHPAGGAPHPRHPPPEGSTCGANAGLVQRLETLEQSLNLIADEVEALTIKVDALDSIDYDSGAEGSSEEGDESDYDEYGRPLVAEKPEAPASESDPAAQKAAHAKHRRRTSNSILRQLDRLAIRVKEMSQASEEVKGTTIRTAATLKELKEQYEGTVMHTSRGLEDAKEFLADLEMQVAVLSTAAGASGRAAEAVAAAAAGAGGAAAAVSSTTAYSASLDAEGSVVLSSATSLGFSPDLGSFDPEAVPIPALEGQRVEEEGGGEASMGSVRALASVRDVLAIVNAALAAFKSGKVAGLPNLAAAATGATVARLASDGSPLTSEPASPSLPGLIVTIDPASLLGPSHGACWPLAPGGTLTVRLPGPAAIAGVTLEQPEPALYPLGAFRLYGVTEAPQDGAGAGGMTRVDLLAAAAAAAISNGTASGLQVAAPPLVFDAAGPPSQTFLLPTEVGPFSLLQLAAEPSEATDAAGFSCLYGLQVHGGGAA